jgi:hypothetical protein
MGALAVLLSIHIFLLVGEADPTKISSNSSYAELGVVTNLLTSLALVIY